MENSFCVGAQVSRKGIPNKVKKPRSVRVALSLSPDELAVLEQLDQPNPRAAIRQLLRLSVFRPRFEAPIAQSPTKDHETPPE